MGMEEERGVAICMFMYAEVCVYRGEAVLNKRLNIKPNVTCEL